MHEPWLQGQLVKVVDEVLDHDGFLGSRWFAGRVWEIDYRSESFGFMN